MAGAAQVWQVKSQRDKEAELLYVGEQFRQAIMSYYNTGTKQYPETLENLLEDKRLPAIKRHLRKIYKDPITNTADWAIVEEPPPGTSAASSNNPVPNKDPALGSSSASTNNQAASNTSPLPNKNPGSNNNLAGSNTASSSSSGMSANITKRIIGVYSLSEKKPIKKDKFPEHFAKFSEAVTYQDWKFVFKPGDTSGSPAPSSKQPKPNTAPGSSPSASPFTPQSSPTTGASRPSSGNPSPFSPQSSSAASPHMGGSPPD